MHALSWEFTDVSVDLSNMSVSPGPFLFLEVPGSTYSGFVATEQS